jgi:hypothetical protein
MNNSSIRFLSGGAGASSAPSQNSFALLQDERDADDVVPEVSTQHILTHIFCNIMGMMLSTHNIIYIC